MGSMEQAAKKEEGPEETWNNPFTQAQLETVWADFVEKHRNVSPSFAASIGKYKPTLGANFEIHFPVDNLLFEHETDSMAALKTHLKNTLHNNQYKLIPEVQEKPAEIDAYTDKDKFEKMAQANPMLRMMQAELKLEGDLWFEKWKVLKLEGKNKDYEIWSNQLPELVEGAVQKFQEFQRFQV